MQLVARRDGAGLDDVRVFRVRDLFSTGGNDGQTLHERVQAVAGSHEDVGQRHLCPRHPSPTFCGGQVKSSHYQLQKYFEGLNSLNKFFKMYKINLLQTHQALEPVLPPFVQRCLRLCRRMCFHDHLRARNGARRPTHQHCSFRSVHWL